MGQTSRQTVAISARYSYRGSGLNRDIGECLRGTDRASLIKVPSHGATLVHATVAYNKVAPCGGALMMTGSVTAEAFQ